MIQDWGSNHLYLRHANTITRVSTIDHSYKDVIEAPNRDYDSNTTTNQRAPAWVQAKAESWMCGASKNGSQKETKERGFNDDYYILEPFLEDLFKPLQWSHILATLDVCTNEVVPTQFCDEQGYGISPLYMVQSKSTLEHTTSGIKNEKCKLPCATNA